MKTKKQVIAAMMAALGIAALQPNAAAEQKFQKLTSAQIPRAASAGDGGLI